MKTRWLRIAFLCTACPCTFAGQTNEWTKPTSGYWQENYWSLGTLPGAGQDWVFFRNPGFKALAIAPQTRADYPASLSISNLYVEGPTNSLNVLLLDYFGLAVPLSIASDFVLGTNASVLSFYSALQGRNFYVSSPAGFDEGSVVSFDKLELQPLASAQLNLTNSSMTAQTLTFGPGSSAFQSGGASTVSNMQMFAGSSCALRGGTFIATNLNVQYQGPAGVALFRVLDGSVQVPGLIRLGTSPGSVTAVGIFQLNKGSFNCAELDFWNGTFAQNGGTNVTTTLLLPRGDPSTGDYFLNQGTLVTSSAQVGKPLYSEQGPGNFVQAGGVHTNASLSVYGVVRKQSANRYGTYSLRGGLLVSESLQILSGSFTQDGGTNLSQELNLDELGLYTLNDGSLVTSNSTIRGGVFVRGGGVFQNGGRHTVANRLWLKDVVSYELRGGTLDAPNIEVALSELLIYGGVVRNSSMLVLHGDAVRVAGQNLQFGKLQVVGDAAASFSEPFGPKLDVGAMGGLGATEVRFLDSRDVPWSGSSPLYILNWSQGTNGFGPDHVFVGTNEFGLTATQLSQVVFYNPWGFPPGNYAAKLLPTGELVPAVIPSLAWTAQPGRLILSWPGNWQLVSATNVLGPYSVVSGATSPFTNPLTGGQGYFRLRLP